MDLTQVLSARQMAQAEQALFDEGTSVSQLMEVAAGGAAEWVRRVAAGRRVTVLCGPGNNGGDGYVIARRLKEAGNPVEIVAPIEPKTDAAKAAREAWGGNVHGSVASGGESPSTGGVFVDCLFGSGLSRPLEPGHALMLRDLAARHDLRIAIDVPSGIASDSGEVLNPRLPDFDITLALGAWKFAHWTLPGRASMGEKKLVPIGIDPIEGAAQIITRPHIDHPARDTHKYRRGLAMIVGGAMPGAGILAATAAQRAGAGYVKLLSEQSHPAASPALVIEDGTPGERLSDDQIDAVLIGPGLGRSDGSLRALRAVLQSKRPAVLDADALHLLDPDDCNDDVPLLATPHDGELEQLCRTFGVVAEGRKDRAMALARMSGITILAKGPDSVVAAPDGRLALAKPAPSWLSTAGTGDVLAGIAVSRMATGADPFAAACEASWLHGEAARQCGPAFTAFDLANSVDHALARCL